MAEKLNYDYLVFLQDQMEQRKSKDFPKKIADSKEEAAGFMILNMCWNEYIKIHAKIFPSFDSEEYKKIWIKTKKLRLEADSEQ